MRRWPRLNHWGATPDEIDGPLVGDERVASPDYTSTSAITIHAPPVDVWPWLSQMGYGRLTMAVLGPAAFTMTRRMLLGIRERAEALALHRSVRHGLAAPVLADAGERVTPVTKSATRDGAAGATGATERAHVVSTL